MSIDSNDPRPPYKQVADDLRRKIRSGEKYGVGDRLPSIRALAKEYGISPQTAQNALRELRLEGLVVSQQGRAFFVRDPDRPTTSEVSELDPERLTAVESELQDLRERVVALAEREADLQTLIMDLYSRLGQPYPGSASEGAARREQAG